MMKNFKSTLMLGAVMTLFLSASAVPQLAEAGMQADGVTQATPQNPPSRQKKGKTSKSKKKGKKGQKGKKNAGKGCCSSSCCKAGTKPKN